MDEQWTCPCGAFCRIQETPDPGRDNGLIDLLCPLCGRRKPDQVNLRITPRDVRWEITTARFNRGDRARVVVPLSSGRLVRGQIVRIVESSVWLEEGEIMVAPGEGPGVSGGGVIHEDQLESI
jgi:hypothetical protein